MRIRSLAEVLVVASLTLTLLAGCTPTAPELTADLILDNTTVIDVRDGTRTPGQTVVIRQNKIVEILPHDPGRKLVAGQAIDASGTFLIPGLWDMHVHAAWPGMLDTFYPQLLAHGVTGIRDTWGNRSLDAASAEAIESGDFLAPPRRVIAGNLVDGSNPVWPGSNVAEDAEQARAVVDELHASGAPFVKVYSKLSREAYFAIAERATELGMPFAGHIPASVSAWEAADVGQRTVEHLTEIANACTTEEDALKQAWSDYYRSDRSMGQRHLFDRTRAAHDEGICRELLQTIKESEMWQVPTLITLRGYAHIDQLAEAGDERLRYLSPSTVDGWHPAGSPEDGETEASHMRFADNLKLVGLMNEEGVPILAGSDTPNPWAFPGSGLHDELALLVEAGLSPHQALVAATLSPAIFFDREEELGTVEEGKLADLVLLEADPLEQIDNVRMIRGVIADGRFHGREELDAAMEAIATRIARPSVGTWVREALEAEGIEAARRKWVEAQNLGDGQVNLNESELNRVGYELIGEGRYAEAIAILELNRDAFPDSANVYDSLGDAMKAAGRLPGAREMYAKAVQIAEDAGDPDGRLDAFRRNLASIGDE